MGLIQSVKDLRREKLISQRRNSDSRLKQREFPGSPAVRTWRFHYRGLGSLPGWGGTKIPPALRQGPKNNKDKHLPELPVCWPNCPTDFRLASLHNHISLFRKTNHVWAHTLIPLICFSLENPNTQPSHPFPTYISLCFSFPKRCVHDIPRSLHLNFFLRNSISWLSSQVSRLRRNSFFS